MELSLSTRGESLLNRANDADPERYYLMFIGAILKQGYWVNGVPVQYVILHYKQSGNEWSIYFAIRYNEGNLNVFNVTTGPSKIHVSTNGYQKLSDDVLYSLEKEGYYINYSLYASGNIIEAVLIPVDTFIESLNVTDENNLYDINNRINRGYNNDNNFIGSMPYYNDEEYYD